MPHEKVRVGIIDTGAQLDHPDLENVINKDDKAVFELYDKISGISYPMEKTGCVWGAEIPPTVSSVIIKRLNPSNNAVWNSWETEINGSTFTATSSKSGSWA